MYKIYFSERPLIIDHVSQDHSLEQIVVSNIDKLPHITKLLQNLQNTKGISLICENPDEVFRHLASQMRVITAAGGLVTNKRDEFLMIFRNGCWDLPKGKLERGESVEQCAVREVREECGLEQVVSTGHLTITYHIYVLNGEYILKPTHWYTMTCADEKDLTPQQEEGITDVRWVVLSDIPEYLKSTYATIVDVFRVAGI